MEQYYSEILTVTTIAIVMVISPGQDFAMITRNSLLYSRRAGMLGALGISVAIWLHVTYSLAGIALIISQTPFLYNIIKYAGAAYLCYLGISALFYKKGDSCQSDLSSKTDNISDIKAFRAGFISNALNPKTTLFFLSIFTQVVSPETPIYIQLIFGAIISIAHFLWFVIVALVLSSEVVTSKIDTFKLWIERIMGTILCALAAKILLT
ncbi:LysE family translocator [Vibrio sp. EA2]|uniref:LysE family translocator n=1 Tax=Vibrio sp. EA2 TaxID=3079860 RepID=UPI002949C03F|nr:LysE family transporter [Vibrio sp. EA2]MDV6252597.1 LysE family transporter [Vibrio sp. EA2]